ncbi:FkbM family methyltransferase [Christiangramia forsetii]|uniref:Methyltransferase FkbM domain-containing protein n=2 Tax=Christiangramia forsetii TaxID=411153 RepID=A0LYT3_CHRFK|nr:FkbM family methyltransferase [Christiangramia forsetii]GGG33448.1 hypothetical protein GCM10011532_16340 [Christiangramia forsetii]CAL65528.1 conserved hypothetical protein [Christiangramia forsetii KT0803]
MNYKKFIKKSKNFLLTRICPKPSKEQIEAFVRSLRPVETDKPLMRLGGVRDGGYLIPDDVSNIKACFSPGVGRTSNFELACANLGMEIYMADASVNSPVIDDDRFNFLKKFIGAKNRRNFITLENWLRSTDIPEESDLLLQMDVEGYEYEILKNINAEILGRFRIIVIEFHRLTSIEYPYHFHYIKSAFDKLLKDHKCVHIHPNNCCEFRNIEGVEVPGAAEFTFLRKDRINNEGAVTSLPHPLDRDNVKAFKSINLPEFWYK